MHRLQNPNKSHQVLFLLLIQIRILHQIKKFHSIFQGQKETVMQVGRGVLDAPQEKILDGAFGRGHAAVDHLGFIKAFHPQLWIRLSV
jgi:hypothetical protein